MKGQMYLLAAAILAAAISIYLATFKPVSIDVGAETIQMQIENSILENIVKEFKIAWACGYSNYTKMNEYVTDFGKYIKEDMKSRSYDFNFLTISLTNNETENTLTIFVSNFLGNDEEIALNLNGTVKTLNLSDSSSEYTNFTSLSPENYILNVSYENYTETFNLNMNHTFYVIYSDLRVSTFNAYHRKVLKETYIV